jgi:hypothetical protein
MSRPFDTKTDIDIKFCFIEKIQLSVLYHLLLPDYSKVSLMQTYPEVFKEPTFFAVKTCRYQAGYKNQILPCQEHRLPIFFLTVNT